LHKEDRSQRIHASAFEIPCSIFDINNLHRFIWSPLKIDLFANSQNYVFKGARARPPRLSAAIRILVKAEPVDSEGRQAAAAFFHAELTEKKYFLNLSSSC
jgi:hypothetical protein